VLQMIAPLRQHLICQHDLRPPTGFRMTSTNGKSPAYTIALARDGSWIRAKLESCRPSAGP